MFHNNHDKHKNNIGRRRDDKRINGNNNKGIANSGADVDANAALDADSNTNGNDKNANHNIEEGTSTASTSKSTAVAAVDDREMKRREMIKYYIENPRVVIVLTMDRQTERPLFDTVNRTVQNIFDTVYSDAVNVTDDSIDDNTNGNTNGNTNDNDNDNDNGNGNGADKNGSTSSTKHHNRILSFLFVFADDVENFQDGSGNVTNAVDFEPFVKKIKTQYRDISKVQPDDQPARIEVIQLHRSLTASFASSGGSGDGDGDGDSNGDGRGRGGGGRRGGEDRPKAVKRTTAGFNVQPGINSLQRSSIEIKAGRLVDRMERNGDMSMYEDVTLLFIRPGAEILTKGWLDVVTDGLRGSIVPLNDNEKDSERVDKNDISEEEKREDAASDFIADTDDANTVIINPANAISFALDGAPYGESYSLNYKTQLKEKHQLSNQQGGKKEEQEQLQSSYPTAILEGTVTAMKLQTYLNFPVKDRLLDSFLAVDLEMSYNLWLCGDGIDILPQLVVKMPQSSPSLSLPPAKQEEGKNEPDENEKEKDRQNKVIESLSIGGRYQLTQKEKDATGLARSLQTWAIKNNRSPNNQEDMEVIRESVSKLYHINQRYFSRLLTVLSNKAFPLPPSNQFCRDFAWYYYMITDMIDDGGNNSGGDEVKEEGIVIKDKEEKPKELKLHVQLSEQKRKMMSKVIPINIEYDDSPRGVKIKLSPEETKKQVERDKKIQEKMDVLDKEEEEKEKKKERNGFKPRRKKKRLARRRPKRPEVTPGFTKVKAIGENGMEGYIHNVTSLRHNPPEFHLTDREVTCSVRDETWKLLTEKVSIDFKGHEVAEKRALREGRDRVKLLCVVYTIEYNHARIQPIRETWGKSCDGFIVASNKTDVGLDIVHIPHEGADEYDQVWFKVQAIWSYIYDNYYNDYDWFHIGGDGMSTIFILSLFSILFHSPY